MAEDGDQRSVFWHVHHRSRFIDHYLPFALFACSLFHAPWLPAPRSLRPARLAVLRDGVADHVQFWHIREMPGVTGEDGNFSSAGAGSNP